MTLHPSGSCVNNWMLKAMAKEAVFPEHKRITNHTVRKFLSVGDAYLAVAACGEGRQHSTGHAYNRSGPNLASRWRIYPGNVVFGYLLFRIAIYNGCLKHSVWHAHYGH
ncbi:hypothetical protein DPMN_139893 [Dreissena polymorpha]|uniref:Uncharacterized protein n=1 Tax=Dreissena polymorpha TaxID=45954 RepID=A0A9D4G9X9_DREPO|nr:hypothetical protein DPMN_139893 [Dreissena polymorpha]